MKRLILAVAVIFGPTLAFAGPCALQLVPPTALAYICQDINGNIVFQDASGVGPVTLRTASVFGATGILSIPASITSTLTLTPPAIVVVATNTSISPSAAYLALVSSGGPVTLGNGTIPSISTITAINGQVLILGATQLNNTVIITSGTTSQCDLGAASRTIGYGKRLGLQFDAVIGYWVELFYGNN